MKKIFNPILFQGHINKSNYFEGWYYKQVSLSSGKTVCFIPGISLSQSDPHAFVQAIISPPVETFYFRYPLSLFSFSNNPFSVKIAENAFFNDGFNVFLENRNNLIKGKVHFSKLTPLKKSILFPNIMGPFAYLPGIKCNHGVISLNHNVSGIISYNENIIAFKDDKGYLEKDWGVSFPEQYIWMQANSFPDKKTSFMLSIASVPFLKTSFKGLISVLNINDCQYRFASYNSSKVTSISIFDNEIAVKIKKGSLSLDISASGCEKGVLKSPVNGSMKGEIKESPGGKIKIVLKDNNKITANISSDFAGIEIFNWQ